MEIKYLFNGKLTTLNETSNLVSIEEVKKNNRITITIKAKEDIELISALYNLPFSFTKKDLIFLNGYQSWTDTKETYFSEKEKLSKRASRFKGELSFEKTKDNLLNKYAFDRYGDVLFYPYSKHKLHGYDVFYVKGFKQCFSFNYNYKLAMLTYEIDKKNKSLNMYSDIKHFKLHKDEEFKIFDFAIYDNVEEGLKEFQTFFSLLEDKKILGYTSCYNYYQDIKEDIILRDLEGLDNRFNLFQIDDGYETFVGDWLDIDKNKFPNGLKEIVNKIHNKGLKAGIWLAPFVAEEKSKLFNEHKELFKKDDHGNPIKCGGNWSGFYVLDLENSDAISYIKKCLNYYMELGFDFFKLDFLYSVSLPKYNKYTRAMITDYAYKLLRDTLKDKMILGCGALTIQSRDYFDYLRVGPDVSLIFDDVWFMRLAHRERISTKVTLQNTIYRSVFNRHIFLNDPDVFLLRSDNIKLSNKQKEAILIIDALFGSVLMTSDNIKDYDSKSNELLNYAFDLSKNAKDISYKRDGKYIILSYNINGKNVSVRYNTKKGVLENDR